MESNEQKYITEITTNFKRGTTEMLLLSLLTLQDWYVYELSKVLKEMSKGLFDIQGPSLYTVLYRLEKKGFVETNTVLAGRRARVYYHLLPSGREHLERIKKEYLAITDGIAAVLTQTAGENAEKGEQTND